MMEEVSYTEDIFYQMSKKLVWGEILARQARKIPEKTAIVFEDKTFTYKSFNERVNRLSNALLKEGIMPGDKVAFVLYNGNEILESYFAAFKIGAVAVPLNYRLASSEMEYALVNSEAKVIIYDQAIQENLGQIGWTKTGVVQRISVGPSGEYESWIAEQDVTEPLVSFEEEDPALIMYTAGTTGKPKGAVLTHKNLYINTNNFVQLTKLTERDCWFSAPPLFHIAALVGALHHIYVGGKNVTARNFKPLDLVKLIEREKVTGLVLIPTMWLDLLQMKELDDYDTSSLRICWTGGSIAPLELKKKIMAKWGTTLYDGFGQTEMSPVTTLLLPEDALRKADSVGKAVPTVELRVVDDKDEDVPIGEAGEIIYRGPTMMLEYYRAPEATAEAFRGGWFHSGDIVRIDEEGFVYVVGRKKDMIISGGENIYPAEIESVLYEDHRIFDVAVIGLPDPRWGESVAAVVVLKPGETMTKEEVVEVCAKKLASYKKPKRVFFVDALLKNSAGKVVKNQIRDHYISTLGLKEQG